MRWNVAEVLYERFLDVLACPDCRHPVAGDPLVCGGCGRFFSTAAGYPDFAPEVRMKPGLGPFYLQDPLHVTRYETETRAAFLRIMGANWDGDLTPEDEDEYLRAQLAPVAGPVLDLACGAGRWTRTVAGEVGEERVIGLDLSTAMIDLIRGELPNLCVVRGTATRLPFATASLGAVNCSNALQLLPDPRTVIQEIGRCLRPGGTLTAFTFRQAGRATYRHFQRRHEETFNVRAFRVDELVSWMVSAGLELTDLRTPADTLLFTARRAA
jgi:SAM-dependent methyltransferase